MGFPVVVGTVAGAFWLSARVSLGPTAGFLYLLCIGAAVVAEFVVLRPLLDAVGEVILRPGAR